MYNRGQGRQQYQARDVGNRAYGQEFQQGNYGRQEDEGYGQQQFGQSDYGPGREYGESEFGYGSQYPNQGQSRGYGDRGDQGGRYEGNRPYRGGQTYEGSRAYQGGQGYESGRGGYFEPYYGGTGQPYYGQSYGRGDYGGQGRGQQRGWWDPAGGEGRSWFGDENAARRRQFDEQRGGYGGFYSSHERPGYGTSNYGRSDYGSNYGGMSAGQTGGLYTGRGPKGWKRGDERIMEDVCQRLTEHPGIDASDIEVKVENGEVTLTGTIEDRRIKRMAEDTAEDVSGVTEVHNQLRVKREGAESMSNPNQGKQQGRQSDRGMQRATN